METLRLAQSELIFRRVLDEIEVEGRRVPAGWNLRVCVRESHQDPAVFTNPRTFDPDRFEQRFNRSEYSPLGMLGRTCLGAHTVHVVAGSFVRHLASYDLEVTGDGPVEFDLHWRPSTAHRIVLVPAAEIRAAGGEPRYVPEA